MKTILIITSVLLVVLMTGCAVGPDFTRPVVDTPEQYSVPDTVLLDSVIYDSSLNLLWWEIFSDPVIDTLVRSALANNKDIGIAFSRLEESRALLGFSKADILPNLGYQGSASRGNLAGTFQTTQTSNNFFVAPVVNWEIDFWGKFRRANEAARAEMMASAYGLHAAQIGLISEVIGTYFLLRDYRRQLKISQETLRLRLHSLDIIQKRFDKGIIPEIDLNQQQIQKEIAEAAIPAVERAMIQTENALSVLLGRLPGSIDNLLTQSDPKDSLKVPVIPSGLPSALLERRPDVRQSEFALQAQNARIGVAQAVRFPSISLTGMLGAASSELASLTDGEAAWSISGSITGPIFNFNKNVRRVEVEEERTRQALLRYENTVLNAFREVEDALTEVRTYQDQFASVKRKLTAARTAANLSGERYDKGVTSFLEVLESERTLFSVEIELSQIKRAYGSSYVKLYKALGGGWISETDAGDAAELE